MVHYEGYTQSDVEVLFFDVETGGFRRTDDILQICVVGKGAFFNRYVKPSKDISPEATSVHGLTRHKRNLFLHGKRVISSSLRSVLTQLLEFLRRLAKPCVLVAHNCPFDASRLLLKIKKCSFIDDFRKVILGFTDTLSLLKKRFPDRGGRGSFKLTTLAKDFLNLSHEEVHAHAHNAVHDVKMLEQLALKFFSRDFILKSLKSYDFYVEHMKRKEKSLYFLQTLSPLKKVVSKFMLERMAYFNMHYNTILSQYRKGEQRVINFLERRVNGRPQVIKSKRVLNAILGYLREHSNDY